MHKKRIKQEIQRILHEKEVDGATRSRIINSLVNYVYNIGGSANANSEVSSVPLRAGTPAHRRVLGMSRDALGEPSKEVRRIL